MIMYTEKNVNGSQVLQGYYMDDNTEGIANHKNDDIKRIAREAYMKRLLNVDCRYRIGNTRIMIVLKPDRKILVNEYNEECRMEWHELLQNLPEPY